MYKIRNIEPAIWQTDGARFSISRYSSLLAMATGTGKSITQMLVCFALLQMQRVKKCMLVGTLSSCIELMNDLKTKTTCEPIMVTSEEELANFFTGDDKICIVRYETLQKSNKAKLRRWLQANTNLISFDEVHKLKNPKSKIGTFFRELRPYFTYLVGATATPMTANIDDLFYIMDFIAPGLFGSRARFWNDFVDFQLKPMGRSMCYKCGWNGYAVNCPRCQNRMPVKTYPDIRGYKNEDQLKIIINTVQFSFFPEQDIEFIKVEGIMSPKTIELYLTAAQGVIDNA